MAEDNLLNGIATVSSAETMSPNEAISTSIDHVRAAGPGRISDEAVTKELIECNSPGSPPRENLYDFLLPVVRTGAHIALGPYQIVGLLGVGGMGIVLKAEDPKLGRSVAIKMLEPSLAANSASRQRFLREARAAAAAVNDHIVPIYHVGEDRGVPYLVMPLLVGETLESRLRREGQLHLAEVLRIGREVAAGLEAAHERGLVHRDIKPANLWLDADNGRVRILDFGLVRMTEEDSQLSQIDRPIGTLAYMAPEQARGETVGPRADLFSLGCVLYRISTGVAPFNGATRQALYRALECDQPVSPDQLQPEVPSAFAALVLRLLAKDPGDRPASARDVVGEIKNIEHSLLHKSSPPRRPRRLWTILLATAALFFLLYFGFANGPTVYRLLTDQGDLVIKTNDPDVEVIIKDKTGKVIDRTGKREILLKAGEYEIDCVIADGLGEQQFLTRRLTIRRGDRLVVDAHIESPKRTGETAGKVLQSLETRAANWALSRKATGKILVQGRLEDLAAAQTKRHVPFQVVNLFFGPNAKLGDPELGHLEEMPSLASLKLQGGWVNDSTLAHLRGLSKLHRIDLVLTQVSDRGLVYLGEIPNLDHLIVINAPVTDAGLAHLKSIRNLRHLALGFTRVTEAGMDELAAIPTLAGSLILDNCMVTDTWLPHLSKLSRLTILGLASNPIGDAGLVGLEAFPNLEDLNLSRTKVTDAGLVHVRSLRKLRQLHLAGTTVTDAGLSELSGLSSLQELDLTKTKVTAEGAAALQKALPKCRIVFAAEVTPGK
jgi:serine/threonine protein kinase